MQLNERLAEDDRTRRRTIADALEVLRAHACFGEADCAQVRVGPLQLPSGDVVGLVDLEFVSPFRDITYLVSLPTSANFRAMSAGSSRRKRFAIARLNRAMVSSSGQARLADGIELRAIEVVPARLAFEPSELDWRIVHQAIATLGIQETCYRSLRHGLPVEFQKMVPDEYFLDCSTLPGLSLPMFKIIAGLIQSTFAPLETPPSQQQIANSLRKFGIRVPKTRPRKKARRVSALMSLGQ